MDNSTMVLNVVYQRRDGRVVGAVLKAHDYSSFTTAERRLVGNHPEPAAARDAVARLVILKDGELIHGLVKHSSINFASLNDMLQASPTTDAGQVDVLVYSESESEWLSGLWNKGKELSLDSVADFQGYRVSAAKLATRVSMDDVRAKQTLRCNWLILRDALFLFEKEIRRFKPDGDGYEAHPAVGHICDWWNQNAPEPVREAAYFRVYIWDQVNNAFISGDPEEPALQTAVLAETPTFALFEEVGMPTVAVVFFKGRQFNTFENHYTQIYYANGAYAWEVGLPMAEVDEALYSVRGLNTLAKVLNADRINATASDVAG